MTSRQRWFLTFSFPSFAPTSLTLLRIKMYKMRIKQWGFQKKKIQHKIRAIARKNKLGVTHKKRSLTNPDDSNHGYEVVIRHEKRRRMANDVVARSTALTKVDVVEYFKPITSPIIMPQLLGIAESIFCSLWDYYEGSFERGIWVSDRQGLDCYSTKVAKDPLKYLNALLNQCTLACRLFANNHYQRAGQALITATAGIKKILEAEHPMTLNLLSGLLLNCQRKQRHSIALAILRQFSAFGQLLLGDMHPLSRICGWLASVDESHCEEIVLGCLRSTGDQFEVNLGPMHRSTLDSRLRYIDQVYSYHDVNQEEALQQSLLEKCERNLGAQDIRTLDIRSSLAFRYLERRDYAKAKRMGEDTLAYAHQAESPSDQMYLRTKGHYVLAVTQYKLHEPGLAIANMREALALRKSEWGVDDSQRSEILVEWLLKQCKLNFDGSGN